MQDVRLLRTLIWVVLFLLAPALVFGQAVNSAQIQGRITDATGASIPAAKITATQTATGLVRTTTANAEGNYSLPNLPVGPYQLQVSAIGFREYLQKGIVLQVGENPTVNVMLQVGTVSEKVEVTAAAAMVETSNNAVQSVIDNSRIMEMPLNGRNLPDLIMLSGGASNLTLPSNDLMSNKNFGANMSTVSQAVSVAGSQENANNYLLDGGDNNDLFSNINAPFPFPDAVQEFNVQSNGLSARYGVHSGAVVNMVTKAGTNAYHGSGFEFLRNNIINAQPVTFTSTPLKDNGLHRNQFGGTFGGPLKKDKVLFFMGYQGTRQSQAVTSGTPVLPTPAALTGDFSTMLGSGCKSSAITLKNIASSNPIGAVTFTGRTVNPAKFSPVALALISHLPTPTDPCGKFNFVSPQFVSDDQGIAKVDWNINSKHQFSVRYFADDFRNPPPAANDPVTGGFLSTGSTGNITGVGQFARFQSLILSDTYAFNSGFVNTFHATGTRMSINRSAAPTMTPAQLGVNAPSPIPNAIGYFNVSGYFGVGGGSSMPGHFNRNLYQFSDDIDVIKGKHQLSFGANYMWLALNYLSTLYSNGQYQWSGSSFSGDPLVDFMLGIGPTNVFNQGNPEWENWRMNYVGFYAHDTIKLRPNLTLNAGIRWEPYLPSKDTANRGSHFDFTSFMANVHSSVFPNGPAGTFYCGDTQVSSCSFQKTKILDFSPRVGVVWDPRGKGQETLRAGYGLFYDMPELFYFDRFADNSPYGSVVAISPGTNTLANPYQGQSSVPLFPLPFPTPGSPNAYFPAAGGYISNDPNMKVMYAQNWNMSFEKQFGANWMFSSTYMGSKTTHIWVANEGNPGLNVNVPANVAANIPSCSKYTGSSAAPSTSNINCRRALNIAASQTGNAQLISQSGLYSYLEVPWDGANANYNALLLTAKHRMSKNFNILTNYTYSHCISDQDFTGELTTSRPVSQPSPISAPNANALTVDRGNCSFDIRHAFNTSLVVESPKFEGTKGMLLNHWQLAPLIAYRSGQYYSVASGTDVSLSGIGKDRPNQIGDPNSGSCTINGTVVPVGTGRCAFNPALTVATGAAWLNAPAGSFGTLARNTMQGPSALTFNTALSRGFRIREGKELTFRFEVFNLLNHVNYSNPVSSLNSTTTVGQITAVLAGTGGEAREFQGALKFTF
jgi:carboxypeptidase family protein